MALRCLIVDDSRGFLHAARVLLERQGVDVVGLVSTSSEAVEQVAALQPDVTLVDVDLGGESGFDLTHRLASSTGGSRVILVSTHAEEDLADLIAASPARGFLAKAALSAQAILGILEAGTLAGKDLGLPEGVAG